MRLHVGVEFDHSPTRRSTCRTLVMNWRLTPPTIDCHLVFCEMVERLTRIFPHLRPQDMARTTICEMVRRLTWVSPHLRSGKHLSVPVWMFSHKNFGLIPRLGQVVILVLKWQEMGKRVTWISSNLLEHQERDSMDSKRAQGDHIVHLQVELL